MKSISKFVIEKLIINKDTKNIKRETNDPTTWQIGDILCGTWGYSMTLPEWYQIVKKTPKGFGVVELSSKIIKGSRNGQWEEIPDESKREKDLQGKVINCRIKKYGGLKIENTWVHLWDGETPLHGDDMD